MDKATQYLISQLSKVNSLYVRAIAAYALTFVDHKNYHAVKLYEELKKKARVQGEVWFPIYNIPNTKMYNTFKACFIIQVVV